MDVGVLGPLELPGRRVVSPRDRVVLEALVVHARRPVPADRLADALWGETPPASWAKIVQGSIMRLRHALGPSVIETTSDGYRLTLDGDAIDSYAFEHLVGRARSQVDLGDHERAVVAFERALALWRGRPFGDLDGWEPAQAEAARLDAIRRSAEEALLDARIRSGDDMAAVAEGEALVAAEPISERRWALLAMALYQSGRQGDALRAVQRARAVLADQLGVTPGPELLGLERRLLQQDPGLVASVAAAPRVDAKCPYRGLVPYDVDDDDKFFGRDREVENCLRRLSITSFVAVVGPSGSGKSSLVRAGVASRLRRAGRRVSIVMPGSDPLGALTAASTMADATTVLVIDQLEELVMAGFPAEVVHEFLDAVVERLEVAPVVVALRADHLGSFGAHAAFARRVEQGLHLITSMTVDELRAAIEEPARAAGLRLEPGLTELLLRDVRGEPGGLPLLSFALAETWANREGRVLTVEGYLATGGLRQAIATSAERLYDGLPGTQRPLARSLFLRLVTPAPDGEPLRQRVDADAIMSDDDHRRVVDAFVRTRLVVVGDDGLEVAHEALVREWPRLRTWLDDDIEGQRILRHVAVSASAWDAMGRPDSELYRGTRLAQTAEWRDRAAPDMTPVEQAFLETSEAVADAERLRVEAQARHQVTANRRLRALLAVTALALGIALVAGGLALVQSRRADDRRDAAAAFARESALRALVGEAAAVRDTDRALSALLAVEAWRLEPGPLARSALFGVLTQDPGFLGYVRADGAEEGLWGGIPLPDGRTALVADDAAVLHEIDLDSLTYTGRFADPGVGEAFLVRLAASGDGAVVAEMIAGSEAGFAPRCNDAASCRAEPPGGDDWLAIYDVGSRSLRVPPIRLDFNVGDVAVSPDGRFVVVAGGQDGGAIVYASDTGQEIGRVAGLPIPASDGSRFNTAAVAFDATGRLFVSSEAGPVRIIDPTSTTETARLTGAPQDRGPSNHLQITDDGSVLVGTSDAGARSAWDLASGELLWFHEPRPEEVGPTSFDESCASMALSSKLNRMFCGDENGVVVAFDLTTGERTSETLNLQQGLVADLLVTPGGESLVAIGGDRPVLGVWRIDGTGPLTRLVAPGKSPAGYSADGELLLTVEPTSNAPGAWDIWDPTRDALVDPLDGISYPSWTNSGRVGALVADSAGVYDFATKQWLWTRRPPAPLVGAAADRVHDRGFVWRADGTNALLDQHTGQVIGPTLPSGPIVDAAFSGDGQHLAVLGSGGVTVYDATTGAVLAGPRDIAGIDGIAASNELLVGEGSGGEVSFFDLLTLETIGPPLQISAGRVWDVAFGAEGSLMMVRAGDRTVRLVDVASRTQLGEAIRIPLDDIGASLRPDGRELAVHSTFGVALWDLDPAAWEDAACRLAGRNLTREEWDRYVAELMPYRQTCPASS